MGRLVQEAICKIPEAMAAGGRMLEDEALSRDARRAVYSEWEDDKLELGDKLPLILNLVEEYVHDRLSIQSNPRIEPKGSEDLSETDLWHNMSASLYNMKSKACKIDSVRGYFYDELLNFIRPHANLEYCHKKLNL